MCDHSVGDALGVMRPIMARQHTPRRAQYRRRVGRDLAEGSLQILSYGPGAKGDRRYRWAVIELAEPAGEQLLIRRSLRRSVSAGDSLSMVLSTKCSH
jgi:hypothetical protein